MSQNAKIVTAIVVILVIAGGAWAFVAMRNNSQMAGNSAYQAPSSPTAQEQTPPQTNNPTAAPAPAAPAATDNSNASIDQDMSGIDGQMTGLNSDSANVDSSMGQQQAPSAQ